MLQFCAIDSPLAQPRNAILGQLFGSVIGVGIAKLFALNPHAKALPELGGALACAITTAVMTMTHTVHPPAGATALLAVTSTTDLGWLLIPNVLLGCALILAIALIINNILRQYPLYWWTSQNLAQQEAADPETAGLPITQRSSSTLSGDRPVEKCPQVVVQRGKVLIPECVRLTEMEKNLLIGISNRI